MADEDEKKEGEGDHSSLFIFIILAVLVGVGATFLPRVNVSSCDSSASGRISWDDAKIGDIVVTRHGQMYMVVKLTARLRLLFQGVYVE